MLLPKQSALPSESTIEHLSNHYILEALNSRAAWILTPTRNEERFLGYDAAMQNTKAAVIQYKRVERRNKDGGVSIKVDRDQHRTLCHRFKKDGLPYAFYAFSDYDSYETLNDDYLNTGAPEFFKHTLFFCIHSFDARCTTLRLFAKDPNQPHEQLKAYFSSQYSSPIAYWRGPEFVRKFASCELGNTVRDIIEVMPEIEEGTSLRSNILLWKMD